MLTFARLHPLITIYVLGMLATSALYIFHPKNKADIQMPDGRVLDLKVISGLVWGITWPAFWLLVLAENLVGSRKLVNALGLGEIDYSWCPHPEDPRCHVSIQGYPQEYPSGECKTGRVLAGKMVGTSGVLAVERHRPAGMSREWAIVAKRPGPPSYIVSCTFDSEQETRAAFIYLCEEKLDHWESIKRAAMEKSA